MSLYAAIQSASMELEIMDKEIIRLLVEGTPGLGKRLLLEKIADFLKEGGFSVTEPTKHEELGSWSIEVLDFEDAS